MPGIRAAVPGPYLGVVRLAGVPQIFLAFFVVILTLQHCKSLPALNLQINNLEMDFMNF